MTADLEPFLQWCGSQKLVPIPLSPSDIAVFVAQSEGLGIDKLAASIAAISRLYRSRGLADPTAGGPVSAALGRIAPIEPPRSWKKEAKESFKSLPYDLQVYLDEHEKQRDKAIRRAQNEAASLRNEAKAAAA